MILAFAVGAAVSSCPAGDPKAQLLAVHESHRTAHLTGNADLIGDTADTSVTMADSGVVRTQSAEGLRSFFAAYFRRVRYSAWADQSPPLAVVSPDGQHGWMAVAVSAKYAAADSPAIEKTFKSSWIATYRRVGCAWKMTGMASNIAE